MPSKQVLDRQKGSRAVTAAAEAHAADVDAKVRDALAGVLASGEAMPDIALLVRLAGRLVARRMDALSAADDAHETELGDDHGPRTARDAAAEKVRRVLIDLRAAVETGYGDAGLARFGLTSAVPESAALDVRAERVRSALGSDKPLPAARAGISVDLKAFAAELDAARAPLSAALADVAREAREAQTTLMAKQRAMRESDRDFRAGAGVIEALAALAGLDGIAATVRPSQRKAGATAKDAGDPLPPAPEPTDKGAVVPTAPTSKNRNPFGPERDVSPKSRSEPPGTRLGRARPLSGRSERDFARASRLPRRSRRALRRPTLDPLCSCPVPVPVPVPVPDPARSR